MCHFLYKQSKDSQIKKSRVKDFKAGVRGAHCASEVFVLLPLDFGVTGTCEAHLRCLLTKNNVNLKYF